MSLLLACSVFVLSPFLPSWVLNLTVGTTVGAVILFVVVLITLQDDSVLGLATFLAVAALFLEQRRRTVAKVSSAIQSKKAPFMVEELNVPAPDLIPGEKHPAPKDADIDDHGFEPTEDSGNNKFDPVDESQDGKQPPLETVPSQPSEVSDQLQGKGLASI